MGQKIYVVDTNIILQNIQHLYDISDEGSNIIVIPETVLMELEDKKKLFNELGYHSRSFARLLAKAKTKEVDYKKYFKVVKMRLDTMELHLISKDRYESEMLEHNLAESNDKRIIEIAELAQAYYKGAKVRFLSIDIYARMFALLKNIKAETLHNDRAYVPEFHFVKQLPVDSSYFNALPYASIESYDDRYLPENFCYEFLSDDGNRAYGIIIDRKIHLMEDIDFHGVAVKPVNLKQKYLYKALLSNAYDLMVVDAKAGSGKTLISIASAMRLIDKGLYEKIVYVRNSIESLDRGAQIGFLAGNEEKFRVYNMALYDTLEFIAKKRIKRHQNRDKEESIKSKVDHLMQKYNIEMLWPGEARGRTLSDAVVIMDEWQNASDKTTQLILSRLDESCMSIVIGSNRQIDNLYLNRYNNGLTTLLKQTQLTQERLNIFAIELDRAVRGKFAEFSEEIFEQKK
ncbi:MAG: PhoH family protein [Sulfurimonas sp.]